MAVVQSITGDVNVIGAIRATSIQTATAAITDGMIVALAGIDASKLDHAHRVVYAQESATTAVAESRVVHVVVGATGTVNSISAGCVVPAVGAATCTVDLKKNGSSILTAPISIDSGDAARALVAGAISSAALAVGDVLEIVTTATAGGGTIGKGLFAAIDIFEDAQ